MENKQDEGNVGVDIGKLSRLTFQVPSWRSTSATSAWKLSLGRLVKVQASLQNLHFSCCNERRHNNDLLWMEKGESKGLYREQAFRLYTTILLPLCKTDSAIIAAIQVVAQGKKDFRVHLQIWKGGDILWGVAITHDSWVTDAFATCAAEWSWLKVWCGWSQVPMRLNPF